MNNLLLEENAAVDLDMVPNNNGHNSDDSSNSEEDDSDVEGAAGRNPRRDAAAAAAAKPRVPSLEDLCVDVYMAFLEKECATFCQLACLGDESLFMPVSKTRRSRMIRFLCTLFFCRT